MINLSQFPEVTTFSSLLQFALELETLALGLSEQLASVSGASEVASELTSRHNKRKGRLMAAKRELLNEVILEPIENIDGSAYLRGLADGRSPLGQLLTLEANSAAFYADSAVRAASVLAEVSKIFTRLAKENRKNGELLAELS